MKKKNRLRKLLKNPLAHPVAVAIGAVTAVGAAAYGIHRWRRAMRLPPGEPTGGNTLEPGSGGDSTIDVYVK